MFQIPLSSLVLHMSPQINFSGTKLRKNVHLKDSIYPTLTKGQSKFNVNRCQYKWLFYEVKRLFFQREFTYCLHWKTWPFTWQQKVFKL